jgi:hypothetical protein
MRKLIVASTRAYTGKSGLVLALAGVLEDRGLDVGYFKPYGTMPVREGGVLTDEDALYINAALARPSTIADICPVVRTRSFVERVLRGDAVDAVTAVRGAFDRVAAARDVVLVEAPWDCAQGSAVAVSTPQIAALLDAPVLMVDRPEDADLPESVLAVAPLLEHRLCGIVLNAVRESQLSFASERLVPFLETRALPVLGVIPHDAALSSVTVAEVVEALGGTVLSAENHMDDTVESFIVGAMGQEKALRFFRRKARKAVITGGDRADVQLAALQTDTRCIILTGNMPPSSVVLARAEEQGVPMILVDTDTLSAVEKMEALLGRIRIHDTAKTARLRALFEENVDLERLLAALGIE